MVVPPAKVLELLRFVTEVYLKFFFFEACPFRSLQWFLGAISCAGQFCRVHTICIAVLGGMCTAHDHQKLAIPHHVLNEVPHRLKSIGTVQSRTSSMVMPARLSRGMNRAVFVVCVWSGTCVTCAPWKGANVLCAILCRLARTPTGLCCTCSARDIARYFHM